MTLEAVVTATPRAFSTRAIARFLPAIAFGLLLFAMALFRADRLLGDPDTQWHIAVGRWIWLNHTVPTTDLFSHTMAGSPWIAKEWVSQLVLFAAYSVGGWQAVTVLTAAIIATCFTCLFVWLQSRVRVSVALAMTLVAVVLGEIHFLARPHIIVLPVILAWMLVLAGALERRRAPPLWAAVLVVAWTNMHGSFPFALVMAGVLAGEGVLLRPRAERLRAMIGWGCFLAVSCAATMVSPFGWNAILVPLSMPGNAHTLRYVTEWQPLAPDMVGCMAVISLILTAVFLLAQPRANLFRILAVGLVAYLMVRHVRFVSLFGLVSPILAARAVGLRYPPEQHRSDNVWTRPAVGAGIAALAACVVVFAVTIRPLPAANVTPTAAFDAAMGAGAKGPVYNDYDFGGFLIAHGVKTFVDGRTDQLFLGGFLPDLNRAIDAKDHDGFASLLTHAKVTWALIRPHSKTSAHFDALPGWSKVYADDVAAAYVRRQP